MPHAFRPLAVLFVFVIALLAGCGDESTNAEETLSAPTGEHYHPDLDLGPLFQAVQLSAVFGDSKTFVDARPRFTADTIVARYLAGRDAANFDLEAFNSDHFTLPDDPPEPPAEGEGMSMEDHIRRLWPILMRQAPETDTISTLIPLPGPYIVPGGQYREVYYWDSFFTMLGLIESQRLDLVQSMIDNFAHQIRTFGFIPNGNRTYFVTRSQPPFFSQMVMLLASQTDTFEVAEQYVDVLRQEYDWWMDGAHTAQSEGGVAVHVVALDNETMLNRYWDAGETPRPEFFRRDYTLAQEVIEGDRRQLWRDLRSESESGWGLSSRWQRVPGVAASTHMRDIIPVDLNALLYAHELALSDLYEALGQDGEAERYATLAESRAIAMRRVLWDEERGAFYDYDAAAGVRKDILSLATVFPLYFGITTQDQADRIAQVVRDSLLAPGGFVTSTIVTGGPWDEPNGWAPLQWLAVRGLERYGHDDLAEMGRERWLSLNRTVYQNTGKMLERYNVMDLSLESGGGDYPFRDGFGWTNGVALAFLGELGEAPVAPR
jgi:alpha,alpha-trehalase